MFRIDHFLGKEATQNLHVLRFANELFGGIWNRQHVAQVQIDVPETLDVAQRAEFYDATGAALDMLVTHLFQVAAEVAMEPPRRSTPRTWARRGRKSSRTSGRSTRRTTSCSGSSTATATSTACPTTRRPTRSSPRGSGWTPSGGRACRSCSAPASDGRVGAAGDARAADARRAVRLPRRPQPRDRLAGGIGRAEGHDHRQAARRVPRAGDGYRGPGLADVEPGESLPPYAGLLEDVLVGDRTLFTTPPGSSPRGSRSPRCSAPTARRPSRTRSGRGDRSPRTGWRSRTGGCWATDASARPRRRPRSGT